MAKLSKTDAAKCIGVSRATLYNYIRKSRITVDPDGTIDTAELLRAGFDLRQVDSSSDTSTIHDLTPSPELSETVKILQQELSAVRQDLRSANEEKTRLLTLLEQSQQQQQRLLEAGPTRHRTGVVQRLRTWWSGDPPPPSD